MGLEETREHSCQDVQSIIGNDPRQSGITRRSCRQLYIYLYRVNMIHARKQNLWQGRRKQMEAENFSPVVSCPQSFPGRENSVQTPRLPSAGFLLTAERISPMFQCLHCGLAGRPAPGKRWSPFTRGSSRAAEAPMAPRGQGPGTRWSWDKNPGPQILQQTVLLTPATHTALWTVAPSLISPSPVLQRDLRDLGQPGSGTTVPVSSSWEFKCPSDTRAQRQLVESGLTSLNPCFLNAFESGTPWGQISIDTLWDTD